MEFIQNMLKIQHATQHDVKIQFNLIIFLKCMSKVLMKFNVSFVILKYIKIINHHKFRRKM